MTKRYEPFLGTTNDRNKAFPGIDALRVSVVQDPHGMYCRDGKPMAETFTKATVPRFVSCVNPRCQQGGIDLQQQVMFGKCDDRTLTCRGHEGSPKGRRKGAPCMNSFVISIKIDEK